MFVLPYAHAACLGAPLQTPDTVRQGVDATALFGYASGAREDNQWQRAIGALHAMLSYRNDWDGMGSPAPDRDFVAGAINLLNQLKRRPGWPAPTRVAATPAGTIGVEWQQPGFYMEAEIVGPDRTEWMLIPAGASPVHWINRGR